MSKLRKVKVRCITVAAFILHFFRNSLAFLILQLLSESGYRLVTGKLSLTGMSSWSNKKKKFARVILSRTQSYKTYKIFSVILQLQASKFVYFSYQQTVMLFTAKKISVTLQDF